MQPRAVCADKDGHPRPADGSSAFSGSIETQKKKEAYKWQPSHTWAA